MFQPSKIRFARPVLSLHVPDVYRLRLLTPRSRRDLVGGAGIFRPKNPDAKRSGNANRPARRG